MKNKKPSRQKQKSVDEKNYSGQIEGENDIKQKPDNFFKTAKKLLALLKGSYPSVGFVMLLAAASALLSVVAPGYLEKIIDIISEQVERKLTVGSIDFTTIINTLTTVFVLFALYSLCSFLINFVMAKVTQDVITKLRDKVNRKLSRLPLQFFDSHNKGDLLSRVTNDIDNINNTFQHNFIQILTSVVTFVGVFVVMLKSSPIMTLASLLPLPIGGVFALIILRYSKRYFRRQWKVTGSINGHIEEMFTGHRIVKAFSHENVAIAQFNEINNDLCLVSKRAQFLSGLINPVINFAKNIGYVFICVIGGYMILEGKMSVGAITAFMVYSNMFMQPLVDMSVIINNLQSSLASAERVFEITDSEEEVADTVNAVIEAPKGFVDFENVAFSYIKEKKLIENFNLNVKPGELVAIVGPTGAGKTTLVNLLMRFYELDGGSIKVDGIDIRDISRKNLHEIFGMVLQDTWLFKGTIRENVLYGHEDVSEEEFESAVKAAKVDFFVSTLPDGYDTVLDEDGGNLSAGQKQLLTIARAIIANPGILILDEATSSVDTRTEMQIQEAMKNLMKGRTNFVIAHRLSTIREADNILVIKDGTIVEQGRHNELLEKKGFYSEIYYSQFM